MIEYSELDSIRESHLRKLGFVSSSYVYDNLPCFRQTRLYDIYRGFSLRDGYIGPFQCNEVIANNSFLFDNIKYIEVSVNDDLRKQSKLIRSWSHVTSCDSYFLLNRKIVKKVLSILNKHYCASSENVSVDNKFFTLLKKELD